MHITSFFSKLLASLFIVGAIVISLSSCNSETGTSGKHKNQVLNGKKHGLTKTYHKNGNLKAEVNYEEGVRQGAASDYYESGKLRMEMNYVDGKKQDLARFFYEDGKLFQETIYKAGKPEGKRTQYHTNGKVKAEVVFKDGHPTKNMKEFDEKGNLRKHDVAVTIKPLNTIRKNGKYVLKIATKPSRSKVTYYQGKLKNGALHDGLKKLKTKGGKAEIAYNVAKGVGFTEQVPIVAKVITQYGNPLILEKNYKVDIMPQ